MRRAQGEPLAQTKSDAGAEQLDAHAAGSAGQRGLSGGVRAARQFAGEA
jgi:hypothetical protein